MFDITEVNERTAKRYIEHIMKLGYMASYFETKYQKIIHPEQDDVLAHYLRKAEIVSWDEDKDVDIKQNSGVYALTFNDETFYVGETTNTFEDRYEQHTSELYNGTHHNGRLQKAYDKVKRGGLVPIKIYLLEYDVCTEENKGCFKLMNLMREYYYQVLVLQSNCGLNNMEDTLKRLYLSPMFNYDYKMPEFRAMEDMMETILKYMKPPKSYKEINSFTKQFKSRLYSAKDYDFYHYIWRNLKAPVK